MEGTGGDPDGGGQGGDPDGDGIPPEHQDAVNKVVQKRLARQKEQLSAQFGDYDDVKAKAAKFDELQAASKSDVEKLTEKLQAEQTENQKLKDQLADKDRQATASRIAQEKGVPVRYVTGEDEKAMIASADQFLEDTKDLGTRRRPGVVPTAGTGSTSKTASSLEAGRERALAQLEKNK
jgi:hypothetical protein